MSTELTTTTQAGPLDLSNNAVVQAMEAQIERWAEEGDENALRTADKQLDAIRAAYQRLGESEQQVLRAYRLRQTCLTGLGKLLTDTGASIDMEQTPTNRAARACYIASLRGMDSVLFDAWLASKYRGYAGMSVAANTCGSSYVPIGALKEAIENSGMTDREIARKANITAQFVRLLKGHTAPSHAKVGAYRVGFEKASVVASVLGINASTLKAAPSNGQRATKWYDSKHKKTNGGRLPKSNGKDLTHLMSELRLMGDTMQSIEDAGQLPEGAWSHLWALQDLIFPLVPTA